MCNLAEGLLEEGMIQGRKEGIEKEKVKNIKILMETLSKEYDEVVLLLKMKKDEIKKYRNLIVE